MQTVFRGQISNLKKKKKRKKRAENVTESKRGVEVWQTEKKTGKDPGVGDKSSGRFTDSG